MERAFPDAAVDGHEIPIDGMLGMPDPDDRHVVAAALKTRASIIVTDNRTQFPRDVLGPLDLKVKSADEFIADMIGLGAGRAVADVEAEAQELQETGDDGRCPALPHRGARADAFRGYAA